MRTTLTAAAILALAVPAHAAGERAEAILWGFAFFPCLVLLLAMPAALAVRAAWGTPATVERRMAGPGHFPRLLGSLAITAMVVLLSAARGRPAAFWMLLLFAAAILFSLTVPAMRLGRGLFRDAGRGESAGAFALGWLVLSGVSLLPVLGVLLLLWFSSYGLGAVLIAPFRRPAEAATPPPAEPGPPA